MRIAVVLFFVCTGLAVANENYAQTALLNLRVNNRSVQDVLDEIEKQSEFHFFYNNNQLNTSRKVSINSRGKTVFAVLDELFDGTDINYRVMEKSIILFPKELGETGVTQQKVKTISGVVVDMEGEPVIGANILQKGSTNGTITGIDGSFTLTLPEQSILTISYLGFMPKELRIGHSLVYNVTLEEDNKQLSEVVITALGIKREEKALGYAVQKVDKEGLTTTKGVNVATSLTGKISGLNIKNSTEFNETPSMLLRGESPLLIIDGIPVRNMSINDIAADDIESIDVLKGATASALYGSRGGSGAIIVTTKKGADNEGIQVEVNSNTMFFSGYLNFPQVQSSYSRGYGGKYNDDFVWGDKLDIGRTAILHDPVTNEWREMELVSKGKNNFKNFLQFSMVTNNNVSVTQQGKYGSFRSSLTHVYNRGQYPNQDLNKFTFFTGGEMSYGNFKMDAGITYNRSSVSNDNGTGYTGSYMYDMVIWSGSEYDVRDYKNYWVEGREHEQQNWYDSQWYDNPYFKANEVIDSYYIDKMNAYANISYEINPWLKAMARAGYELLSRKNEWRNAISANSAWDKKGFYGVNREAKNTINTDAMLMADKTWNKFNVNVLGGGNIYFYSDDNVKSTTSGGITIPGFYSLNASVDPAKTSSGLTRKRVNSLYGKISLAWASTYFLDVTGRNDWSSTLPSDTRSYFYPSVAGSVVLSEIIPLPKVWDFWKIRGSWTSTKQDMSVYDSNNTYDIKTNQWDDLTTANYPSVIIGGNIRPKKSSTMEIGTAVHFLNNRLFADFAYFRKIESDFIIEGGISETTGFSSIQVNFKEERLRNGMELTIGGTPIKTKDVQWDILTNWGRDRYSYRKIDPEYSTKKPWVAKGKSWNWLALQDWDRDPDGNIIHNGGIPVRQNFTTKIGNLTPDLVWGISNTVRYKRFTLNFVVDGRIGGRSYSRTHQMLWNTGVHKNSDNHWRYEEVVNGNIAYVGKGVKVVSGSVERDVDGNILSDTRVFAPNDVPVSYEAYITSYYPGHNRPATQNVLSETFFKLRNLSLTYDIPDLWCAKVGMKKASIGFTGQNLFLWAKEYKYSDPDKGGDSNGHENLNSPSQRYMGVNIKVNF